MGHVVNSQREYRLLQQRLDRTVIGAPPSPALEKIVRLLYRPEDVPLAVQIPFQPTPLDRLAKKVGRPADELGDRLAEMARRGLVIDLEHQGRRYFALPPVVVGFFEFTFMRARDDLPMAELARLFDQYMHEDERFAHSAFQQQTQIGRALIHEEALPEDDHTEVLDWERASKIIESAGSVGISTCACRHKAFHLGKACDAPREVCLSLGYAAETLIRAGSARQATTAEALATLQSAKQAGLAQLGDNVRRKVTYICNCCGCCCAMVDAVRTFNIRTAIVTSSWVMEVDGANCRGCGACVKACPVKAIHLAETASGNGRQPGGKTAVCDRELCLGCGVCSQACKFGGIRMRSRPQKVLPPETVFDRYVAMGIERGKLAEIIFDDQQRLSHRALARILGVLERSPPFRAAMAIKPLKSAFLQGVVRGAKRHTGELAQRLQ